MLRYRWSSCPCIHRQDLLLDVLADAGLIFPQHLGFEFALAIPRHRYLYIAETDTKRLAAVPIPAVIRVLVLAAYIRQLQQLTIFSRRAFSSGIFSFLPL